MDKILENLRKIPIQTQMMKKFGKLCAGDLASDDTFDS